jgi:hypothetical protein
MTVHAILLIPGPGHEALLADGPCGARPPTVWEHRGTWGRVRLRGKPKRLALVLAWEGDAVPEGMDRANRARGRSPETTNHYPVIFGSARALGTNCEASGIGTIVLLDSEGREVER